MRIISGYLKGRRINAPANLPTRPTTDFAKESLFNILNNTVYFDELDVLDLFAGIGSISYEFISRGALSVTAVELNFKCVEFIKQTSQALNMQNFRILRSDVFAFIRQSKQKYDLIFADPPYDLENIASLPDLIFDKSLLNEDGIFVLEHSKKNDFSAHPYFAEVRNYGKVHFTFFRCK